MHSTLTNIIKMSLFSLLAFNLNTAHATDEFNEHKDCENNPISQLGFSQLGSFAEYNDNKKSINQALINFCIKGRNAIPNMGFPTFQPIATADADKWFNQNFPNQSGMNENNTKRIREILALAALNGFTGFSYPKPPENPKSQQNEEKARQDSSLNEYVKPEFNQMEYCSTRSNSVTQKIVSQLPKNVTITIDDWNKTKQQLVLLCLSGFVQGSQGDDLLAAFEYGLSDEAKTLYKESYMEGLKHPSPKIKKLIKSNKNSSKHSDEELDSLLERAYGNSKPKDVGIEITNSIQQRLKSLDYNGKAGDRCNIVVRINQDGDIIKYTVKQNSNLGLCEAVKNNLQGLKFTGASNITDVNLSVNGK